MTKPSSTRSRIRTKIAAALLLVSLVPLALVGVVADTLTRSAAERQVVDSLAGIAAVQEARVNAYASSSLEQLALVASRTQLRLSFADQLTEPDDENVALMQRIMADAVSSSTTAQRIELVDTEGRVVASSDGEEIGADRSERPEFLRGLALPDVSQVSQRDDGRVGSHAGPVFLGDEQLGVVLIETSLEPLDRLMTDYTGLGETGETVLAGSEDNESFQLLGDVRSPDDLDDQATITLNLLTAALDGAEGDVSDQLDYRGREVFAVARAVDAVPGWALTVKIDQAEALADANRLRTILIVAFGLAAAAVVAAVAVLARTLTRPVVELHDAAVAVASGDTDRRARIMSNDELAELATQFNRMTDELTAANARLQLTNEQLEEFVYISSHDLKSPLRSISSFGQLLQAEYDQQLDDNGRKYLEYIRDGASRMHRVIEDLLDYLRIEKQGHVAEAIDLGRLVDDVLKLHGPDLEACGADVRVAELPTIEGSGALIRQLFDNLIQNAIRYRHPDRPLLLDITAEQMGDGWRVGVADNGIGIDPDQREEAFTVFRRLSATGDGTGMGLAICRRIVRRHGGEVELTDSPHGGVAVIVSLPASHGTDRVESLAAAADG